MKKFDLKILAVVVLSSLSLSAVAEAALTAGTYTGRFTDTGSLCEITVVEDENENIYVKGTQFSRKWYDTIALPTSGNTVDKKFLPNKLPYFYRAMDPVRGWEGTVIDIAVDETGSVVKYRLYKSEGTRDCLIQ